MTANDALPARSRRVESRRHDEPVLAGAAPRTSEPIRWPGLDLLRSIAIVWVMLFHSFVVGGLGPRWDWLARYGWMGVDLFFVLSGFLIGTQLLASTGPGRRLSLRDFYRRRARRILPAYFAVLAAYCFWPAFREAPGMEPAWKFATFVVNLSIDYGRNTAFSHAWSLCVEEHFYLAFPLLAPWLASRATKGPLLAAGACVVGVGIASRGLAWWHGVSTGADAGRNWYVEDVYYPTWNRLDGLLAGVALALWKVRAPRSWARARRHADALMVVGLATTALACWLFRDRVGWAGNTLGWPVLALGFGALVFAGAGRGSVLDRWRVPGAAGLAAISYSLYLVHKAAYHLVEATWGAALEGRGLLAFIAYGGAALAAGTALHFAVERPFLRWRQRLPNVRTDRAASTSR